MAGGYDSKRMLRILLICTALFVGFGLLQPYGLGWVVVPAGLGVALLLVLAGMWRSRRARRRLDAIRREMDGAEDGSGRA